MARKLAGQTAGLGRGVSALPLLVLCAAAVAAGRAAARPAVRPPPPSHYDYYGYGDMSYDGSYYGDSPPPPPPASKHTPPPSPPGHLAAKPPPPLSPPHMPDYPAWPPTDPGAPNLPPILSGPPPLSPSDTPDYPAWPPTDPGAPNLPPLLAGPPAPAFPPFPDAPPVPTSPPDWPPQPATVRAPRPSAPPPPQPIPQPSPAATLERPPCGCKTSSGETSPYLLSNSQSSGGGGWGGTGGSTTLTPSNGTGTPLQDGWVLECWTVQAVVVPSKWDLRKVEFELGSNVSCRHSVRNLTFMGQSLATSIYTPPTYPGTAWLKVTHGNRSLATWDQVVAAGKLAQLCLERQPGPDQCWQGRVAFIFSPSLKLCPQVPI